MPEGLDAGTSAPAAAPAAAPEATQGQQTQTAAPQAATPAGGGHPAWDSLRSAIGDSTFTLIRPHLEQFDRAAQDRITSLSSTLDGYKGLGEMDQLQQAMQLAQAIENDPVSFHSQYGDYLRSQGLLEEAAAADAQAAAEGEDPSPFEDETPAEDPRIAQLMERFEQQEFEQQVSQESQKVDAQLAQIRTANPWMTDDDQDEMISRAQGHLQRGDQDPLATASTELIGLRNRYMSAPRAVDSAPRLIPPGGGNPASAQQPNVGQMSASQRQALVTQMLQNNR